MQAVQPQPFAAAKPWLLPLLLLLGLAAHAGAVGAGRLADDAAWVRDDAAVAAGFGGIGGILAEPRSLPTSEGRPERPLMRIAFAIEHAVLPGDEASFRAHHLGGLLWHLVAVALLFVVVRQRSTGLAPAVVAAGLFAIHPLGAPAVTAIAVRGEQVALVLLLAATIAWQQVARAGAAWWVPALALLGFAAFAHETAIAWPLVLLSWGPPDGAPRARLAGRAATAAFLVPVLGVLAIGLDRAAPPDGLPEASAGDAFLLAASGIGRTIVRFALPSGLVDGARADAILAGSFALDAAALAAAALPLAISAVLLARIALRRAGRADGWIGAVVLLGAGRALLTSAGHGHEATSCYAMLATLAVAGGFGFARIVAARPALPRAATALGVVVAVGALIVLARDASTAFADEPTLAARRLARNPDDLVALERLATFHRREAEAARAEAAGLRASDPRRAAALKRVDQHGQASLSAAHRATEHPAGYRRSASWAARGLALLAADRPQDARAWLERAVQIDPVLRDPAQLRRTVGDPSSLRRAELFDALARVYEVGGDAERAIEPRTFAAMLAPEDATYLRRAGLALNAAGRYADGFPYLDRAVRALSGAERADLEALVQRERDTASRRVDEMHREGRAALDRSDYLAAQRAFRNALALDPDHVATLMEMGYLAGRHFGRYEEGLTQLERADEVLRRAGLGSDDPARVQAAKLRDELIASRERDDARLREEREQER